MKQLTAPDRIVPKKKHCPYCGKFATLQYHDYSGAGYQSSLYRCRSCVKEFNVILEASDA